MGVTRLMKYKVGDIIKIKIKRKTEQPYNSEHLFFAIKNNYIATIKKIGILNHYKFEESDKLWWSKYSIERLVKPIENRWELLDIR